MALTGMPSAFPTACHQMDTNRKEAQPKGSGNCPLVQVLALDQTRWLYTCIDNMQASVPLIHPCYDKEDRNGGLAILFKPSDLLSKGGLGRVAKQKKNLHLTSTQGFQISI